MENTIIEQIKALFSGADERNWSKVKSVMSQQVLLDYSSMSNSPAVQLSPEQIVTTWASFYRDLKGQTISFWILKLKRMGTKQL